MKQYRWVDLTHELESPPARAVWIETIGVIPPTHADIVTARKGGVD